MLFPPLGELSLLLASYVVYYVMNDASLRLRHKWLHSTL